MAGRQIKRCHITIDDTEIDNAIQDAAYAWLPRLLPEPDPDSPPAPLEHERSAWVRHILQPDEPDLAAYLADQRPPGPAGNPTAITEISGQVL